MSAEPTDTLAPPAPAISSPGPRDVLGMYPALREDHVRYLQKWGFITPRQRGGGTQFSFAGPEPAAPAAQRTAARGGVPRGAARPAGRTAGPAGVRLPARCRTGAHHRAGPKREPPVTAAKSAIADVTLDGTRALTAGRTAVPRRARCSTTARPTASSKRRAPTGGRCTTIRTWSPRSSTSPTSATPATSCRKRRRSTSGRCGSTTRFFEAHFNLGNIHHDLGRHADAVEYYRRALSLNGQYAEGHFYLAVTLEKLGRSPEARQHWRAYQFLAPDGEWVDLAKEFGDEPGPPPR